MLVENIEYVLIVAIMAIQFWFFFKTKSQILNYRYQIIPFSNYLKVSSYFIPTKDLYTKSPPIIFADRNQFKKEEEREEREFSFDDDLIQKEQVTILDSDKEWVLNNKILNSINAYLIRNRKLGVDFQLIRDIVERNIDTMEAEINLSIGTPLYLGLMGTMLGIIIGLFNVPNIGIVLDSQAKDALLNQGITLLIGGVKIAMMASFSGLLLTTLNTSIIFKGAKSMVDIQKNDFYTFLQIELLPAMNTGIVSTLETLQRTLGAFDNNLSRQLKDFSKTVSSLEGIFDAGKENILAQKEFLEVLENSKFRELSRYNINTFEQISRSIDQFEKFNGYLNNINLFVDNSQLIISKTNELLQRTDNFKTIAENLNDKLGQSKKLLDFLDMHFRDLEQHKNQTNQTVAEVGFGISKTFEDLKIHIQHSSESIKRFTVEEADVLRTALQEGKSGLSNLIHLSTLSKDVAEIKKSNTILNQGIIEKMEEVSSLLLHIDERLKAQQKKKSLLSKIQDWLSEKI